MNKEFNSFALSIFVLVIVEIGKNEIHGANKTSENNVFSKEQFCNEVNFYQSSPLCICHPECSTYNRCCPDEKAYCKNRPPKLEQFVCTDTPFYGSIYMINKCLPNYPRSRVVDSCKTNNRTLQLKNFLSLIPVTTPRNITYKNLYCAVCNNEDSFFIWKTLLRYESENQSAVNIDPRQISNITVDTQRMKLVSKINDTILTLQVQPYSPFDKSVSVKHCRSKSTSVKCSICEQNIEDRCYDSIFPNNTLFVSLANPYLPRMKYLIHQNIFENPRGKFHFPSSNPDNCYPQADEDACLINNFFKEKENFIYVNKNKIILLKDNTTYDTTEWSHTLEKDFIYVCGRPMVIPPTTLQEYIEIMNDFNTILLDALSALCLFLLLIAISADGKKKLKGLAYKVTFSTCFTQFLLNVFYNLRKLFDFNVIFNIILHFLCLSYFSWVLVAAYNLWEIICHSSAKFEVVAKLPHFKKYLLYCFIGWGLPFILVLVTTIFEFAPVDVIPCKLKPSYSSKEFINQEIPFYYFFFYPITAICLITTILFGHTFYYLYIMQRRGIKLPRQNHYFRFYLKLALAMGVSWTIYLLLTIYKENALFNIIRIIIDSSQGIFMFFAYGFQRKMVVNVYEKLTSRMSISMSSTN